MPFFAPRIHNCSIMESYATSPELRVSLVFNIMVSIVATPILLKGIWSTCTAKMFHVNTRMQILVHLLALLIHTAGRLALHSIDLFNYLSPWTDACQIIPDFYRCLLLRALYNIGLALSSMCSIALVIERYAAYIYSATYEKCPVSFGVLLVFLQFFLAGCYLSSIYFTAAFRPGDFTLYYCQTIASSSGSIWYVVCPIYAAMMAMVVSRAMFEVLMRKTEKRRLNLQLSLSNHYTLEQGLKSISILKLVVNLNSAVFIILSIVVTTLHFFSDQLTRPRYIALVEIVHFLPLYSILLFISIDWKLKSLEKQQKKSLAKEGDKSGDVYFEQLRKQMQ